MQQVVLARTEQPSEDVMQQVIARIEQLQLQTTTDDQHPLEILLRHADTKRGFNVRLPTGELIECDFGNNNVAPKIAALDTSGSMVYAGHSDKIKEVASMLKDAGVNTFYFSSRFTQINSDPDSPIPEPDGGGTEFNIVFKHAVELAPVMLRTQFYGNVDSCTTVEGAAAHVKPVGEARRGTLFFMTDGESWHYHSSLCAARACGWDIRLLFVGDETPTLRLRQLANECGCEPELVTMDLLKEIMDQAGAAQVNGQFHGNAMDIGLTHVERVPADKVANIPAEQIMTLQSLEPATREAVALATLLLIVNEAEHGQMGRDIVKTMHDLVGATGKKAQTVLRDLVQRFDDVTANTRTNEALVRDAEQMDADADAALDDVRDAVYGAAQDAADDIDKAKREAKRANSPEAESREERRARLQRERLRKRKGAAADATAATVAAAASSAPTPHALREPVAPIVLEGSIRDVLQSFQTAIPRLVAGEAINLSLMSPEQRKSALERRGAGGKDAAMRKARETLERLADDEVVPSATVVIYSAVPNIEGMQQTRVSFQPFEGAVMVRIPVFLLKEKDFKKQLAANEASVAVEFDLVFPGNNFAPGQWVLQLAAQPKPDSLTPAQWLAFLCGLAAPLARGPFMRYVGQPSLAEAGDTMAGGHVGAHMAIVLALMAGFDVQAPTEADLRAMSGEVAVALERIVVASLCSAAEVSWEEAKAECAADASDDTIKQQRGRMQTARTEQQRKQFQDQLRKHLTTSVAAPTFPEGNLTVANIRSIITESVHTDIADFAALQRLFLALVPEPIRMLLPGRYALSREFVISAVMLAFAPGRPGRADPRADVISIPPSTDALLREDVVVLQLAKLATRSIVMTDTVLAVTGLSLLDTIEAQLTGMQMMVPNWIEHLCRLRAGTVNKPDLTEQFMLAMRLFPEFQHGLTDQYLTVPVSDVADYGYRTRDMHADFVTRVIEQCPAVVLAPQHLMIDGDIKTLPVINGASWGIVLAAAGPELLSMLLPLHERYGRDVWQDVLIRAACRDVCHERADIVNRLYLCTPNEEIVQLLKRLNGSPAYSDAAALAAAEGIRVSEYGTNVAVRRINLGPEVVELEGQSAQDIVDTVCEISDNAANGGYDRHFAQRKIGASLAAALRKLSAGERTIQTVHAVAARVAADHERKSADGKTVRRRRGLTMLLHWAVLCPEGPVFTMVDDCAVPTAVAAMSGEDVLTFQP